MFITSVLKLLGNTEMFGYLACSARFPSFHHWRSFGTNNGPSKRKEHDGPNRIIAHCPPKWHVFMEPRGKVAIITGGTTGIGLAVAYELLHAGAFAVVCSSHECKDENGAIRFLNDKFGKSRALYLPADVNSDGDFISLFEYALARYRRVDILFNNAGIWNDYEWEKCIDTNVAGTVRGTLAALKYMKRERNSCGGLVVNCSSTLGFETIPSAPGYCASQHAIAALGECLGEPFHYQHTNLRVLTLCPGITLTDMYIKACSRKPDVRLCPETKKWIEKQLKQDTYCVARAFLYLLKYGLSGHHYVVEGSQMAKITLPPRQAFTVPLCFYKKKRLFGLI